MGFNSGFKGLMLDVRAEIQETSQSKNVRSGQTFEHDKVNTLNFHSAQLLGIEITTKSTKQSLREANIFPANQEIPYSV